LVATRFSARAGPDPTTTPASSAAQAVLTARARRSDGRVPIESLTARCLPKIGLWRQIDQEGGVSLVEIASQSPELEARYLGLAPDPDGRGRRVSGSPSDRELGIRAQRTVGVERLGLEGASAAHAERYEPSPPGALDEMLLGLDVDLEASTFTDLGCGKGRVLCQAARHPFARVVGVELSAQLASEAELNVARMHRRFVRAREIEVRREDAARHRFSKGPRVVYMYNPFRGPVLRAVLANLLRRVDEDRAPTFLLYFEPVQRAALEARSEVTLLEQAPRWATYRLQIPG